jgi:hypothetical protein
MAEVAKPVYAADITYGLNANMRGHWIDRIAGIDGDLGDMEKRLTEAGPGPTVADPAVAQRAVRMALARPQRPKLEGHHTPPAAFDPGKPLELSISFGPGNGRKVNLLYRRADQSQRWQTREMQARDNQFRGAIPAAYTDSPYPLLYYFEVHEQGGSGIYPGFAPDLSNQPYFLTRSNRPHA